MKAIRLITEFYRTPWALLPETLSALHGILMRWADGARLADAEIEVALAQANAATRARPEQASYTGNMIAVLPIMGVVGHRAHLVRDVSSGIGTSTEMLAADFRAAMKDPNVAGIVLDVDSPGGSAFGVAELAGEVFAARGQKPVLASVNSMAASAAYWLASAAEEVYITPNGMAGSIGVWSAHEDWSAFMEKKGVKVSLISAGKYKVEGNPYEPLGDEARGAMQDIVNKYYNAFTGAVAQHRGAENAKAVKDGYGQGRVLLAKDAVAANLADGVATFEQVIGMMQKRIAKAKPAPSASRLSAQDARIKIAEA